jgi:ankyrin repeat protein
MHLKIISTADSQTQGIHAALTAINTGQLFEPLHFANTNVDIFLLNQFHGFSVTLKPQYPQQALTLAKVLFHAVAEGKQLLVKTILKTPLSPDILDQEVKLTPLMLAITKNNLPMIQRLHKSGASLDAGLEDGTTPLILALKNNPTLAHYFIENKAQVDAINTNQENPLNLATMMGREDLSLAILAKATAIDTPNIWGRRPLLQAVITGMDEVIEKLLQRGANPNHGDKAGLTPLISARRNRQKAIECLLLKYGANPIYGISDSDLQWLYNNQY